MSKKNGSATAISDETIATATDAARESRHEHDKPYKALVTIEGIVPLICHRYDTSDVETKEKAGKGSKTKKTDNIDSYVYRVPDTNELGVAAKNIKSMLASKKSGAARAFQDPRSKRASACALLQAAIFVTPEVPSLGKKTWDFLDRSRMTVQQSAITRVRPCFNKGWRLSFEIVVGQPALVPPEFLRQILDYAAAFVGLCDSRPDFGRFSVVSWEIVEYIPGMAS